ncbi:MAG: hypothetical protein M1570_03785 [Chloroflexi bacterium]|nr:hypothetical protein [Chloroflexota bacterium]
MRLRVLFGLIFSLALVLAFGSSASAAGSTSPLRNAPSASLQTSSVRILYFYSQDCPHCQAVQDQILTPLETRYGSQIEIRKLEISVPANYELLIRAEEKLAVRPEQRGIPTLVIDNQALIGQDAIRDQLPALVEHGLAQGGIDWPDLPGLAATLENGPGSASTPGSPGCQQTQAVTCSSAAPIWVAYFYQTGCQKCSRAEADLAYVRTRYSQIVVDPFNVYDQPQLGQWLAERSGRKDFHTPAVFIGNDVLIGETEITPQNIEALAVKYSASGAARVWNGFDPANGQGGMLAQFRALGPLTVVFAGLVDGLNPCAFATLIFLVSYLTFSGRHGRDVIAVGGAFTLGVFLAYLGVGLGMYKVLDLMGGWLTMVGRWIYALTAVLCAVLAVISFRDWLKARRGKIEDMSLRLPSPLRKRVNALVRSGQQMQAFVAGAFLTGAAVSLVELACTGQIYLPTIIFVASIPELRLQAVSYLVLYNLVFILPLIVVFILAYYGTTSHQLGRFLEQNTARVKLGTVFLFAALATWLGISLL